MHGLKTSDAYAATTSGIWRQPGQWHILHTYFLCSDTYETIFPSHYARHTTFVFRDEITIVSATRRPFSSCFSVTMEPHRSLKPWWKWLDDWLTFVRRAKGWPPCNFIVEPALRQLSAKLVQLRYIGESNSFKSGFKLFAVYVEIFAELIERIVIVA